MPIIEIKFIEGVVAPDPEQKRQLIERLTEDFIQICGEVTRPFVYCLIHETPQLQWGISGVPMPDLPYLTGERRAEEIRRANQLMNEMQAQQQQQSAGNPQTP
jgi:4-oxalocrotonate tautomerase